mmetsp:Transcript_21153/g.35867  ORF Transcript_21153/g.35867 Transcript_21153/m.35867 type:complete len:204 (-) Transcript_21153:699-1310(-)
MTREDPLIILHLVRSNHGLLVVTKKTHLITLHWTIVNLQRQQEMTNDRKKTPQAANTLMEMWNWQAIRLTVTITGENFNTMTKKNTSWKNARLHMVLTHLRNSNRLMQYPPLIISTPMRANMMTNMTTMETLMTKKIKNTLVEIIKIDESTQKPWHMPLPLVRNVHGRNGDIDVGYDRVNSYHRALLLTRMIRMVTHQLHRLL